MMSDARKRMLIQEARMQTEAIGLLGVWWRFAISLMTLGILLCFWSLVIQFSILRGVFGIILTVIAGSAAFLIQVGRKNGKRNVENILKAASEI